MQEPTQEELIEEVKELRNKIKEARRQVNDASVLERANRVSPIEKLKIKTVRQLKGHLSKVFCTDWEKNAPYTHLMSASQDGFLIIWDTKSQTKVAAIPLKCSWVLTCSYSPSGQYVASAGLDNTCTILSLKDNYESPMFLKELCGHDAYISCCKYMEDNKIMTCSGDKECKIWDIDRAKPIHSFTGHTRGVMSVSLSPTDPFMFCSGSCDGTVKVWDTRKKNFVGEFDNHKRDVNCVMFFPDGKAIGSGSDDGTGRLFDLRSDQQLISYDLNRTCNGTESLTSLTFSKSGRLLFTGGWDGTINVIDVLKTDNVLRVMVHENVVQSITSSPIGSGIATGSWDSYIKILA